MGAKAVSKPGFRGLRAAIERKTDRDSFSADFTLTEDLILRM